MNTTTIADLRFAMIRLTNAMTHAGLDTTRLHLQTGSKLYGRAFRLYLRDPATGGLHTVPGMHCTGFLGMTKAETVRSLDALCQGVEMATPRTP